MNPLDTVETAPPTAISLRICFRGSSSDERPRPPRLRAAHPHPATTQAPAACVPGPVWHSLPVTDESEEILRCALWPWWTRRGRGEGRARLRPRVRGFALPRRNRVVRLDADL